jgi:hypothetical protein
MNDADIVRHAIEPVTYTCVNVTTLLPSTSLPSLDECHRMLSTPLPPTHGINDTSDTPQAATLIDEYYNNNNTIAADDNGYAISGMILSCLFAIFIIFIGTTMFNQWHWLGYTQIPSIRRYVEIFASMYPSNKEKRPKHQQRDNGSNESQTLVTPLLSPLPPPAAPTIAAINGTAAHNGNESQATNELQWYVSSTADTSTVTSTPSAAVPMNGAHALLTFIHQCRHHPNDTVLLTSCHSSLGNSSGDNRGDGDDALTR